MKQNNKRPKFLKKCIHSWNGQVNTRGKNAQDMDISQVSYVTRQDYVICKKCATIKIIREYMLRVAM